MAHGKGDLCTGNRSLLRQIAIWRNTLGTVARFQSQSLPAGPITYLSRWRVTSSRAWMRLSRQSVSLQNVMNLIGAPRSGGAGGCGDGRVAVLPVLRTTRVS